MKIVEPGFVIEDEIDGAKILRNLEKAARTCYKSEGQVTADSSKKLIKKIIESGHESVLEHEKVTVRIICDRGVSHEIVRHRLASYSQESTRYCNYSKDKFDSEISVICPFVLKKDEYGYIHYDENSCDWMMSVVEAEKRYMNMVGRGVSPQIARSVLPTCLKTEIVWTANLREWRTIFTQRTSKKAHPQMRQIMCPLLAEFRKLIPIVFDDIGTTET